MLRIRLLLAETRHSSSHIPTSAPLAIAVQITGMGNEVTALSCAIYFWARVVYAPLYYWDVPYLKTTVWSISLGATLMLAVGLLQ